MNNKVSSIGVFDSGFGGLTVFKSIAQKLPQYNYIYLGDNARSPYGDHSFETVYQYTLECVEWLFAQGCPLVILACNTASAKALRSIQQLDLPKKYPNNRVLGVIRPTAEVIGNFTKTQNIGVMGTRGTINSNSYPIEISRFFPTLKVHQQSCPMWVPIIENGEHLGDGADFFVKEYVQELLQKSADIDCILLACTHYPLLIPKIEQQLPENIQVLSQGEIVANSLANYLQRHTEIESKLAKHSKKTFYTSGDIATFNAHASVFLGEEIKTQKMNSALLP
ncbi:glutamate racemase [Pedobacter sp. LMG 31464]|uniref:Glutamate racemase n=1 Tax=Pedobacter planticolens TaxID=2679964 RepID=A0A923DZY0_9SPHI|nr:glutamate racemase [Pedobacter planticolens]MBB2147214.1 glutamate racemase [Pedobacter planticolens]